MIDLYCCGHRFTVLCMNFTHFKVPPIEQKRIAAFINDFIMSTVSFLNDFITTCEIKFVEFEQKMQRIESSLLIVEAKVFPYPSNTVGNITID